MYLPAHFRQDDPAALRALIRAHPLGMLARFGAGGLSADPLPFLHDDAPAPHGVLRAHVARANPLWRELDGGEVMVIFQDPGSYVTPAWYPTKDETGKVVPTWNYVCVQAWGVARAIEDRAWLRAFVERLTNIHESGRAAPWRVDDAPADYIERMLGAIVGIEIPVARMQGKWKASQNRGAAERQGVVEGLRARGDETSLRMAGLVEASRKP